MTESTALDPLPGLMPRGEWAKKTDRCDRTAKRLQDAGKIVVHYVGKIPYVDLEATAARIRGKDKRRRRGRLA